MKKAILFFLSAATLITLNGCGGGDKSDDADGTAADSVNAEARQPDNSQPETFFQIPSPGEMLTFIKMVGGKNNKDVSFLNNVSNEKKYNDKKSMSMNFGIYSCDLSYCSIFELGSESLKYFKVVKSMGDQIGVATAIKPEVLKRIENNIGNADSLASITDDIYFSSFETLEEGKQGPTLALVVAGGWLESLYIATSLKKYEEKSPLGERLADQKYTLDNMIEFLKKHSSNDKDVDAVKNDFENLAAEFNKIKESKPTELKSKAKNAATLEGGSQLVMDKSTYENISAKIKDLRNSYTN